jgi:PadR family transcriptional regulator, regulatory protein PadR
MEQQRTPRMTIPTQLVLRALLADPSKERYGVEIGAAAGLPSGTIHPILARLEGVGWLTSRWEDIDPRVEGRPARRYYQLTPDGLELARAALARAYSATARPAWLRPLARSHDRPGVPGDQQGRPAHLVGELGGPLGLAAAAL